MLMTAGLGTRLRPFTHVCPKPLLPVMGVPTAQFGADLLVEAGVGHVVANVHALPDLASRGLKQLDLAGRPLKLSDERNELLGSAGWYPKALSLLGPGPVLLANGDVLFDLDARELLLAHARLKRSHGVTMTLALREIPPNGPGYRELRLDARGERVTALGEIARRGWYYAGVAILEPEAFEYTAPHGASEFLPSVLRPAVERGKVGAWGCRGRWLDVGDPTLWRAAHLELLDALEVGRLSSRWRRRIEGAAIRAESGIWVSREGRRAPTYDWAGPCFWAPLKPQDRPPARLGPGAVLYGEAPSGDRTEGIGYAGAWV